MCDGVYGVFVWRCVWCRCAMGCMAYLCGGVGVWWGVWRICVAVCVV